MRGFKKWDAVYSVFIVLMVLLLIAFLSGIILDRGVAANQPYARNGVLDLTGFSFDRDGSVKLGGEWEFYDRLLETRDFDSVSGTAGKRHYPVARHMGRLERREYARRQGKRYLQAEC